MSEINICIVEDESERREFFLRMFRDMHFDGSMLVTIDFCFNKEEAIQKLSAIKYILIFLDHDLGEGGSGYDVSKIIAGSINDGTMVVIHSMNPVGASNIESQLKNNKVIRMPFGTIKSRVKEIESWIL